MDKVLMALGWIKQQHFWLLSVLLVVIGLVCWQSATATLSKEFASAKTKIKNEFAAQENRGRESFHPNDAVNTEQALQVKLQADQVKDLWQQLYKVQQEAVLKWPESLGRRFQRNIERLKFGEDIPQDLRRIYLDYAKKHFSTLPKRVGALELPAGSSKGGGRGAGGTSMSLKRIEEMISSGQVPGMRRPSGKEDEKLPKLDFLVYWSDQNQVRNRLTFATEPTSLKIWVTQEDLWVYTAMLDIIANTNRAAGATRWSNAAIRVIDSLEVGGTAAQKSLGKGRILVRKKPIAESSGAGMEDGGGYGEDMGGGYGEDMGGGYGEDMGGGYGDGGFGDGATGGGGDLTLLTRRYLDETGTPIEVAGAWSVTDFGQGYKRLPIRMSLQMDQRWLYHLISECANAPLQIEVGEVRINPISGGSRGGGGKSIKRMYSLQNATSRSSSMGGNRSGMDINVFQRQTYIVPVMIQGTIFIFNEPDEAALTVDEAAI